MLMTEATPLGDDVVCAANAGSASEFAESCRAGRMTDVAMVIAAMAMPANPSATRGTDDTYVLRAAPPLPTLGKE
jgi:hypothetical protein